MAQLSADCFAALERSSASGVDRGGGSKWH